MKTADLEHATASNIVCIRCPRSILPAGCLFKFRMKPGMDCSWFTEYSRAELFKCCKHKVGDSNGLQTEDVKKRF